MKLGGMFANNRPPLNPDANVIRELAGLLTETGLTEIEYAVGDHRIRVARGGVASSGNGHAAPPPSVVVEEQPTSGADSRDQPGLLASPMVGVAYLAPDPGAAPFVRVGEAVGKDQTLLIIEAMKVMNQIRAPHAGRVARIFITDAEPVEYGAALMLIE